jgi:type I restriction enzyme S subunit
MAKYKRYEKYKDSGVEWIGEIPEQWDIVAIKRLTRVKRGASPRPIDDPKYFDENGEFSWVRISDVTNSDMYLETSEQMLSNEGVKASVKIYPNELFISICATVGKPCISKIKCCIHDGFVYFPDFKGDNRYLYYIFNAGEAYKGLGKLGTQLNLNSDTVGSIYIPNISLDVQAQTANFLDIKTSEIDSLVGDKEKLITLLEQKREAIITEAVTKGLKPNVKMKDSGFKWIGEIPEHWEVDRLKNIANIQVSNVDKKSVEGEESVLLCNYTDVYYNDKITSQMEFMEATAKQEQIKAFSVKKGDVLITKDSETPFDIAKASWVQEDLKEVLCGYHLAQIRPRSFMNGRYIYYLHESCRIREQYCSNANGVTRFGLSKDVIKNALVIVPPIEEQEQISDFLERKISQIDGVKIDIKLQIEKLKEYRQSLISEVVTGKIDVRDYCKEA